MSPDAKAAEEFLVTLDELIVEENYLLEQILNMANLPLPHSGNGCLKAKVPNIFGSRDRCAYENLMADELRW